MEPCETESKKREVQNLTTKVCDKLLMGLNVHVCVGLITRPEESYRV